VRRETRRTRHRLTVHGLRLAVLLALLWLTRTAAKAQEAQYFQEPERRPLFSYRWDFLARYDRVDHWPYNEPVDRGRFELRPEIDADPLPNLHFGVRAVFEYGTEEYENPYYDNFINRGANLDRLYVLWRPGDFSVRGGKFGMPLMATEMMWDRDLQTLGGAVSWTPMSLAGGALTFAGAFFYGPQHFDDKSRIGVGQVAAHFGSEDGIAVDASASYWGYDMRHIDDAYFRQNTLVLEPGRPHYASDFHVTDLLVRLRFPAGTVPLLVSLDGVHNFGAAAGRRNAFEGAVTAGSLGTPGQFRASYAYQYIQRDAMVGAYNGDDWWYHTWYEGHRVAAAWTFLPDLYLQAAFTLQRRLDTRYWVHRYLVDLVKLF
jgi:hypothetical protein